MGLVMIDGWWLKGGWTDFDLDIAAKSDLESKFRAFLKLVDSRCSYLYGCS